VDTSTPPPRRPRLRPRWVYRIAYLWAIAGIGWLVASGRLLSYFSAFWEPRNRPPSDFDSLFVTAGLWLGFVAPLLFLAFDLGMQHTEARRLNTSVWRGIRETWRVAWQRADINEMAQEFAATPDDDISVAVLQGVGMALLPPVVFLGLAPPLRTVPGVIWIGGTGILFGVMAYCQRRAAAYLRDDPSGWSMFRQWRLLNPARYEPAGRPFVRALVVCVFLLPFWWLGGGAFVIGG
jgi:hypothetical protein